MNFYRAFKIIIVALVLFSCKAQEDKLFPDMGNRIQNTGYFPLSMDNSWRYQERTMVKNLVSKKFEYTDTKSETELHVVDVKQVLINGISNFEYSLSPINTTSDNIDRSIGSFNQISKSNGSYKGRQIYSFLNPEFNGKEYKKYYFELENNSFLQDNPIKNQSLIPLSNEVFTSPAEGIKINYQRGSKVIDILPNGLPDSLTNAIGIDNHLKKYKNIVLIRDSLIVNKIVVDERAPNKIIFKGELINKEDGFAKLNLSQDGIKLKGEIANPLDFLGGIAKIDKILYDSGGRVRLDNAIINSVVCNSRAPLDINLSLKSGMMDITAKPNQEFMRIDTYWAKEVGVVKRITYFSPVWTKINISEAYEFGPFKVEMTPDYDKDFDVPEAEFDYSKRSCGKYYGESSKFSTNIKGILEKSEDVIAEVPLLLSKNRIVRNLIEYTQRKDNN